jgi:hypothetical protein
MSKMGMVILVLSAVACLWVPSYNTALFGLTPGAILAGLATYLALQQVLVRGKLTLTPEFQRLLVVSIALLVWAVLIYAFLGAYPTAFRRTLQISLGISVAYSTYAFVTSLKRITAFIFVLIAAGAVSALVAIGQFYMGDPFINLWSVLVKPPEERLFLARILAPGLAPTSILLGYQLAMLLPLTVGLLFRPAFANWVAKSLLLLASGTMILALVFCGSRSAIGGSLFGMTFVVLFLHRRSRSWSYRAVIGLAFGLLLYLLVGLFYWPERFLLIGKDLSVSLRPSLALTALQYALLHPFGTGIYRPTEEEYIILHSDPRVVEFVATLTPHNQFLNVLVYYGFPGLFMLITFYWLLFKTLKKSWRATVRNRGAYRWMVSGLAGAFLAYLINSMFHNAGPFVGDWFHWFFIGLVFSAQRLVISSPPVSNHRLSLGQTPDQKGG